MTFASIRKSVVENVNNAVEFTVHTAVPATGRLIDKSLLHVDAGAMVINRGMVSFLTKYPGIALTLSPSTIVKAVAANHVDDLMQRTAHPARRAAITLDAK